MIGRALALAAVALLSAGSRQALAYFQCDSVEKSHAAFEALVPLKRALEQKDAAQLEGHFGKVLADYAHGKLTDAEADYGFRIFRVDRAENEPFHEAWIKAFPKSEAAFLAQANYYLTRAWAARGNDFASKTARSQFAAMEQAGAKAANALDSAAKLSKRPTLEAVVMLETVQLIGDQGSAAAIYHEALKRDPQAVRLRIRYIDEVQPRWGGSVEAIADVARGAKNLNEADRRYVEYWATYNVASDYALHKEDARAAELLERAMPMCPGLAAAARLGIDVYTRTKNYQSLVRAATFYVGANPSEGYGWYARAWANEHLPDHAAAFKDYQRAAQLDYAQAFEALAWFYEGGRGGAPIDHRKAYELYMTAYEKGSTTAKEKAEKVRKGAHLQ